MEVFQTRKIQLFCFVLFLYTKRARVPVTQGSMTQPRRRLRGSPPKSRRPCSTSRICRRRGRPRPERPLRRQPHTRSSPTSVVASGGVAPVAPDWFSWYHSLKPSHPSPTLHYRPSRDHQITAIVDTSLRLNCRLPPCEKFRLPVCGGVGNLSTTTSSVPAPLAPATGSSFAITVQCLCG